MELIVIVPYRDREANLREFVPHLRHHLGPMHFRIAVIEQAGTAPFNKGRLMNAGFDLHRSYDAYYCFHDVDQLPESQSCDYSQVIAPTHLARHVSQFGYEMPYPDLFGAVILVDKRHFLEVDGFSNEFWGWGGEDDDMARRFGRAGIAIDRSRSGRFTSLHHSRDAGANGAALHARNISRLQNPLPKDGLSTLRYTLLRSSAGPGYQHFLIDVGEPPVLPGVSQPELRLVPALKARRVRRAWR